MQRAYADAPTSVNQSGPDNFTPFYVACVNGRDSVAKFLLQNCGIDPNQISKDGVSPFYGACHMGHESVVRLLLADGRVDVNAADPEGVTPLFTACFYGFSEIVALLVANTKVDVNRVSKQNTSPLWIASQNGYLDTVKKLLASKKHVDITIKSDFNNVTAAERARQVSNDVAKWNDDDNPDRRKTNCPIIAALIDDYQKNLPAQLRDVPAAIQEFSLQLAYSRKRPPPDQTSTPALQDDTSNRFDSPKRHKPAGAAPFFLFLPGKATHSHHRTPPPVETLETPIFKTRVIAAKATLEARITRIDSPKPLDPVAILNASRICDICRNDEGAMFCKEESTFCMECEEAIRARSADEENSRHSRKPHCDAARDRIQSFASNLSTKKEQAQRVIDDIDEALRAIDTQSSEVVEQIEQNFAALTKLLDQHRRILVQQVGGKKDLLQAAASREKASLEKTLEEIEKFKASSEEILLSGTSSQLLDFEQEVS